MKNRQGSCLAYRKVKPQATLRVFCFPYAGGGASIFRSWDKLLPDSVELCPVQIPGRETRMTEPPYSRIEPLVELLSHELRPFLDFPYVFFGYSMGALIAFDLARLFSGEALNGPSHLFLAARPGPRMPDPYPRTERLTESEFIRQLTTMGGTPTEILGNPELLEIILPTLRADFALCENYAYKEGPKIGCPLTVFGGKNDAKVTEETLAPWCAETRSTCQVKILDGGHFFIHTHQAELLKNILEVLPANPSLCR